MGDWNLFHRVVQTYRHLLEEPCFVFSSHPKLNDWPTILFASTAFQPERAPDECMASVFSSTTLDRETIFNLLDDFTLNWPPSATTGMVAHFLLNYFQFGNCFYQQIKGMPIGSPINIKAFLQKPEKLVCDIIPQKFWMKYVGDTFIIIKKEQVSSFCQILTTSPGKECTMGEPANGKLPLLDVLV